MGGLTIQRAADTFSAFSFDNMGIDHGCADIFVAQQFLDCADIITVLQKVGRKTVAQGMAADVFLYACQFDGFFDSPLKAAGMDVMAAGNVAARIFGQRLGRKNILPYPLAIRLFVLPGKSGG